MGKPTLWETKKECNHGIGKWAQSPTEKLLAHKGMLDEDFSRGLHLGVDENVTQGGV